MTTSDFDTLVSADWLREHLEDPDLVVLDCTVVFDPEGESGIGGMSGRAQYEAGHIPGAGFADLTSDLADPDDPMPFALPSPEAFCETMGRLGVGDQSTVVLYDSFMSMWAARVWWMLRWVGFDRAALLDGGLNAWTAAGHPVSTDPPNPAAGTLTPSPRPELVVDRDEVLAAIDDDSVCLVDTFMAEHYRGDMAMYQRPGHIRSAVNQSAMDLYDEVGRFRPHDELDALHLEDRDARTITYCGGGIMASGSAFVMHRLGFRDVAVYTASLQEWTADPSLPMDLGDV